MGTSRLLVLLLIGSMTEPLLAVSLYSRTGPFNGGPSYPPAASPLIVIDSETGATSSTPAGLPGILTSALDRVGQRLFYAAPEGIMALDLRTNGTSVFSSRVVTNVLQFDPNTGRVFSMIGNRLVTDGPGPQIDVLLPQDNIVSTLSADGAWFYTTRMAVGCTLGCSPPDALVRVNTMTGAISLVELEAQLVGDRMTIPVVTSLHHDPALGLIGILGYGATTWGVYAIDVNTGAQSVIAQGNTFDAGPPLPGSATYDPATRELHFITRNYPNTTFINTANLNDGSMTRASLTPGWYVFLHLADPMPGNVPISWPVVLSIGFALAAIGYYRAS